MTECTNPEHMFGRPEVCGDCYASLLAELTALRDRHQRLLNDMGDWERAVRAAARSSAQNDVRGRVARVYRPQLLHELTWPVPDVIGMAAAMRPEIARTRVGVESLAELKRLATMARTELAKTREGVVAALDADPVEAEVTRLRGYIKHAGMLIHDRQGRTEPGPCRCPGCELIRGMDDVPAETPEELTDRWALGVHCPHCEAEQGRACDNSNGRPCPARMVLSSETRRQDREEQT